MDLAKYFDHTNLSPTASRADIVTLCSQAKDYGFYSVCIQPFYVSYARKLLEGTDVKVASVVGFPQGQNTAKVKVFEAIECIENGAHEIDMVLNIAALKEGRDHLVLDEIRRVKEACGNGLLKVILETSQLSKDEIIRACRICDEAGADFVKTSTGFQGRGASLEDVSLMHSVSKARVKASGGIRSLADCLAMIEAGASRIGSSSGHKIMQELRNEGL